ncbi:MAG: DsbA family oxidoreductase, partial [Pseudomonadota bacterium]
MTTLDIISDPICPWCYIGKTKLDAALNERPDFRFEIRWRPFQLNPDMPPEGMDRRAYLEQKFGGKEGALRVYGQIADAAEAAGLEIDFAAIKRTPNTIDAHRLIRWAEAEAAQGPVVSQLFDRYFRHLPEV